MKIFMKYLFMHRKSMGLYFLFSLVFLIIFWLYHFPIVAVGYAFLLCTFIGCVVGMIDYYAFRKYHLTLQQMTKQSLVSLNELPQAKNLVEEDYQELLEKLLQEKKDLITEKDTRYQDMMEYYTLWAHQIKTPIAAMRLLLKEDDSDCQEELFKIEQYVEMVLSYLKLDASADDFQICKVDVDDVIRQSIRKYAKLFIRKKLQLVYEPVHYQTLTDEKWLCFIIEQLLSNAIKYTQNGSVEIRMEKDHLIILDSGIGIQKEDIPRIFEKGFTGYNGHLDKKSTGIGLYLVNQISKKLGHALSVESEMGKYTKVSIDLKQAELEVE